MTWLASPPPVVHSSFSGIMCVCVCVCVHAGVFTQAMLQGSLGQLASQNAFSWLCLMSLPPALLTSVISPWDVGGLGECVDGASPSAHFW